MRNLNPDGIIEQLKINNTRVYFTNDEAYSFLETHNLFKEIADSDIPKKTFEYLSGTPEREGDRDVNDYFAHILFEYFACSLNYEPFISEWLGKKVYGFSKVNCRYKETA